MEIVTDLLLLLTAALAGGLVAHLLRVPLMLGYIAAGIAVGPFTAGPTITGAFVPELSVEIGASLLLFALGVEFSLKSLPTVYRVAFIGTPVQMLLISAYGFGIGWLLGWDWRSAFWFGLLSSLSATILVQAPFASRYLANVEARQVVMAILTMQNLLIVPLAFLFTLLSQETLTLSTILLAILEGSLFLGILLLVGAQVLPRLLSQFVSEETPELRALAVVASVAIISTGAYLVNLPFVLVAFAIGLALSESNLNRRTLQELMRVRYLSGFLFFAAAGMLLDIEFLLSNMGLVLITVTLVALGKGGILALVTFLSGHSKNISVLVGLGLFQIGELAVVLAWLGRSAGILNASTYALLVASIVCLILLTPVLLRLTGPLSEQETSLSSGARDGIT